MPAQWRTIRVKTRVALLVLGVVSIQGSMAQTRDSAALATPLPQESFSEPIEDNSFLVEEAYNQDPGVVQHISNGTYFRSPQEIFAFSFTQEWPLGGQTHQISFTVPYSFLGGNSVSGVGDILINYRYQLFTADAWAAVAPRVSLLIPSGNSGDGLGSGVVGIQCNIAASKRLSELFVVHANAGATLLPGVSATDAAGAEVKHTLTSYNLGGSVILLAATNFNFMLEIVTNFSSDIAESGRVVHSTETIVNPGFRFAADVGSLQIVPGFAVPFSYRDGEKRSGLFFYLSFEHPF